MKNLLLKSSKFIVSGMMMGSLLSAPTWAMEELPEEILENTFIYLPPQTLARITPVSKSWKRISEDDKLWQFHGFSSKKKCQECSYPTLEQQHLEFLFNDGYIPGNGLCSWKLLEQIEKPYKIIPENGLFHWTLLEQVEKPIQIISRITQATDPMLIWAKESANPILCTKKDSNLVQYTTNLIFVADEMFLWLFCKEVPYTFTLKGSWSVENTTEENGHK